MLRNEEEIGERICLTLIKGCRFVVLNRKAVNDRWRLTDADDNNAAVGRQGEGFADQADCISAVSIEKERRLALSSEPFKSARYEEESLKCWKSLGDWGWRFSRWV